MGWSLLTVKSEANRDSLITYERGPSLVGLLGFLCTASTSDFLSRLGCSSWSSTKYFFSFSYTVSLPFSPSPRRLGRQSCCAAYLLICVFSKTYPVRPKARVLALIGVPPSSVEGGGHGKHAVYCAGRLEGGSVPSSLLGAMSILAAGIYLALVLKKPSSLTSRMSWYPCRHFDT